MVQIDVVPYAGWSHNLRLVNDTVELLLTLDVGPRILVYRFVNGPNVLKEFHDQLGSSGEPDWQVRGGHRLWTSPEDLTRTYAPDNGPVRHQSIDAGRVRVIGPADGFGIRKEIEVSLKASGSRVRLVHRITNVGEQPTQLAPWALTVMIPGGVEICPWPAKRPHPGPPANARSPRDYAPNQRITLWPFFDFTDPRWSFGSRYLMLRHDANRGPTKLGFKHRLGWVSYLCAGQLFVKRLPPPSWKPYPDGGCNFETFTNEDMLEIESLGPLVCLEEGESTELVETWELHSLPTPVRDETDIDQHVIPIIQGTKNR